MEVGADQMRLIEKMIILQTMDMMWMNHLDEIDYLRDGIGLRGYGQRDPLIEYKREAFNMFSALLENVRSSIVNTIFKINIIAPAPAETPAKNLQFKGASGEVEQFASARNATHSVAGGGAAKKMQSGNNNEEEGKQSPIVNQNKVGRNDPCPCGSGKKYKRCCGA